MTNQNWTEKEMETAITRALEQRRVIAMPESFAARVCGHLPARAPVRRRVGVGKRIAMGMVVIALCAMFMLAARAPMSFVSFSNLAFDMECVLMLQLAGIMCWLAARHR